MTNAGFKALARRFCVGHASSHPVRFNCAVEVFGRSVMPGDLIHADKHGFLVIAPEEQPAILEAARFMDANECGTLIPAARGAAGKSRRELLAAIDAAGAQFGKNVRARTQRKGEWA
jgi:regulator of RNase E activity RraA